jgi:hypothetical protein
LLIGVGQTAHSELAASHKDALACPCAAMVGWHWQRI